MTDPGLGPREYTIEPEHVPFTKRPKIRIAGGVLLVLVVGGGAYGVAQAFSGSTTAATSPPAVRPPPPNTGSRSGPLTQNGVLRGRVTKVGTDSITIVTRSGSQVATVNGDTTYRSSTGATEQLSELKAGDFVSVTVEPNSAPPVAESVSELAGGGFGGGGFRGPGGGRFSGATIGTVASVGSNSFVVNARTVGGGSGGGATTPVTVKVTTSTTYRGRASASSSFSDIKTGEFVFVTGSKSGSTVTAASVTVVPSGGFGGGFGGGGFGGGTASGGATASSGGTQSS